MVYRLYEVDGICDRLFDLRKQSGLTQKELAILIRSNQTEISRIESGHYPDFGIIMRYCLYFDISVYDLMGYPIPKNSIYFIRR